jgi:hypothetical protein
MDNTEKQTTLITRKQKGQYQCCLCLCIIHSWLSLLFSCDQCCLCFCIFHWSQENRRGNQEWKIQKHKQHWSQENRRDNQEWQIPRHKQHWFSSDQCCLCLCIILSWLPILFSCDQCCVCLCIIHSWLPLLFSSDLITRKQNGQSGKDNTETHTTLITRKQKG